MAPAPDSRSRSASPPTCGPPSVLFMNSAIWQYVASPSAWPWPPPAVPAGRRPATGSSPQPRTTADRAPASTEVPWVLRVTKRQSKETWVNREEWLRSDVHEEASVKTGARRLRDFPDIHSASSAWAERHARVCGRSHSIPRRRHAPRRTSGCDLGPATDLDLDDLLPAVPVRPGPESRWRFANIL